MSTTVWTDRLEPSSVADKALKAAARLWFLVAIIGQWAFLWRSLARLWMTRRIAQASPRFKTKIAARQISK
jgi:hypothetical protein